METLAIVIQYVLAVVGAAALVLQAVAKVTGVKPKSKAHQSLTSIQRWVQKAVDWLGVLALNVPQPEKDKKDGQDFNADSNDRGGSANDHSKSKE